MRYCPICKKHYDPKEGSGGMAVDCPYCWEGRTLGPMEDPNDFVPITKCTQCGKDIRAGEYGAYWGMCPECAKKKGKQGK